MLGAPGSGETYGRALGSLIDPESFTALAEALADGVFEDDRPAADQVGDDIGASLDIILDGIGALIERAQAGATEGALPNHRYSLRLISKSAIERSSESSISSYNLRSFSAGAIDKPFVKRSLQFSNCWMARDRRPIRE